MDEILHLNIKDTQLEHKNEHEDFEYFRRNLLPRGQNGCIVALYEIPPQKSAFPYHYHTKDEETYFILSGTGLLKTPTGEKTVVAGDFLYFPANENGAHKLTNTSDSENLVYLDFDTHNDLEVTVYPDSGKIAVWGKDINKLYRAGSAVDYYDGE